MPGQSLRFAVRSLVRHPGHSLINILGLALGLACCLFILLFLRYELSYDRDNRDAGRIYRVTEEMNFAGQPSMRWAITPRPLGPALARDMPGIAEVVRLAPYFEGALPGRAAVSYRDERQFYTSFFYADPNVCRVFDLHLTGGDPRTALAAPNTVVISQSAALKLFDGGPAVGMVLRIDSGFSEEDYRISGVFTDLPANSHVHFDVLASMATLERAGDVRAAGGRWYLSDYYTYVKLAAGTTARQVEERLPAFVKQRLPVVKRKINLPALVFHLQPLTAIHLHSHLDSELDNNGDITYIYVFAAIAALTLLIACVNFMNLSIAHFAARAREVGVRKVVGARRAQLLAQFLLESILPSAVAMAVALSLVRLLLPAFNLFSGREIPFRLDLPAWAALVALTLAAGVLAGSYPALFLSAFRPMSVLRGSLGSGAASGATFRKALIVFQFAVCMALLIGAGVIWDQLRFMRSQDLGYDLHQVVVLPIRDVQLSDSYAQLKAEIGRLPNVLSTTFSSLIIGRRPPSIFTRVDDRPLSGIGSLIIDRDFQDVFKLRLLAGRPLAAGEDGAKGAGFLVNEAAVRAWGFSSPRQALGQTVVWEGWKRGTIVGVVRDFHLRPLQFAVEPLVLHMRPAAFHYLYVRISPQAPQATLRSLEHVWRRILPTRPWDDFFLDDEFARYYRAEERLGELVAGFALAAVFVACLGLLGLAAFTAEKRRREIGIRKVLGSSVLKVVLLLSRETAVLVLLANLLAWPAAYVLAERWLQGFAYRTGVHLGNFIQGSLVAFAVAWLTVSLQALRAALVDPARALRHE
jgi:putative ABC transport system permease protein